MRSSSYKSLHDEDKIFRDEVAAARAAGKVSRIGIDDWYAFTLSYKGVLLEGLEVAFIVLTFGTIQHQVGLASIAAISAVVIVAIAGFALAKPLSRVPENAMKFSVGILLTSFGIFWGAEGSGAKWPGENWAVLGLIVFVSIFSFALVTYLKNQRSKQANNALEEMSEFAEKVILEPQTGGFIKGAKAFGDFWYDFVIGDDWTIAAGIVIAFFGTQWLKGNSGQSWYLLPLATFLLISNSLWKVTKN
jgi:divalent metal cation (Fe/Co/Zn/Cd) transporter